MYYELIINTWYEVSYLSQVSNRNISIHILWCHLSRQYIWVDWCSLVCHLSLVSWHWVCLVLGSLDTSVRKSNHIATSHCSRGILGLGLVETVVSLCILHSVLIPVWFGRQVHWGRGSGSLGGGKAEWSGGYEEEDLEMELCKKFKLEQFDTYSVHTECFLQWILRYWL